MAKSVTETMVETAKVSESVRETETETITVTEMAKETETCFSHRGGHISFFQ